MPRPTTAEVQARALLEAEHVDWSLVFKGGVPMLHAYCDLVAEMTTNADPRAFSAVLAGLTYAQLLGTRSLEARLLASLSWHHRRRGDFARADLCLERAFQYASPEQRSYLFRRRANLRIQEGRVDEAVVLATRSAVRARKDHERALALDTLGVALISSDCAEAAGTCFQTALRLIDPNGPTVQVLAIVHNYAVMLANGTSRQVEYAIQILSELLRGLGEKKFLQRAKINWVIGWCFHRLGRHGSAIKHLLTAHRVLIGIAKRNATSDQPSVLPELAALTADLVEISPHGVLGLLTAIEEAQILSKAHVLADSLLRLRYGLEKEVRAAAWELREQAQDLVPCPPAIYQPQSTAEIS